MIQVADINLTNLCNARCPQCDRTNRNDITKTYDEVPLKQWSFEDFKNKFPTTKEKMLAPTPLRVTDEKGL